jgi:hypothetical protein
VSQRRLPAILGVAVLLALLVWVARRFVQQGHGDARAAASASARRAQPEAERGEAAPAAPSPEARADGRRARDAMRAEILAALRRRDAGAPAPALAARPVAAKAAPSAAPPADEEPPPGHYEPDYIRTHFREDMFPLLRQCYAGALKRRPSLRGKLVLKFSIVGDPSVGGIVEGAELADESDIQDKEMETCARESLMTLTFDKPPTGGGLVNVTYPVAFSPDEEEPAPDGG